MVPLVGVGRMQVLEDLEMAAVWVAGVGVVVDGVAAGVDIGECCAHFSEAGERLVFGVVGWSL